MGKWIKLFLDKVMYPFKFLLTSVYYCKLNKCFQEYDNKIKFINPIIAYPDLIKDYYYYTNKIIRLWI